MNRMRIQGVGDLPAVQVKDLASGDRIVQRFGIAKTVEKVERLGGQRLVWFVEAAPKTWPSDRWVAVYRLEAPHPVKQAF